jgi:hypothetical protein
MTEIICRAMNCIFWEQGVCSAEEIEYEPDAGCLTFQDMGDLELEEEDDEDFDWDSDEELFEEEEDDDDWEDDDEGWDEGDL